MADEINEAFNASYDLLHADAQLVALVADRIYQHQVPPNTTALYLLGEFAAGSDVNGGFGVRLLTSPLILWRVIRKGQLNADMRNADVRMDTVLQSTRAVTSGGYVVSIVRERPHRRTTYDAANNAFEETGGFYRYHISRQ